MHRLHEAHSPSTTAESLAKGTLYPGAPQLISRAVLAPASLEIPSIPHGSVERMKVLMDDLNLVEGDLAALKLLWERLDSLVSRAKRNGWVCCVSSWQRFSPPLSHPVIPS